MHQVVSLVDALDAVLPCSLQQHDLASPSSLTLVPSSTPRSISRAYHSLDMYRMSNAKRHDTATLHTSQPCRLCCITGLEPGIVSASSSAFHELWFPPPPHHLCRCCFPRILRVHTEAPCAHMEGRTSCCYLREHAVDGSARSSFYGDWHFDPPFFVSASSTENGWSFTWARRGEVAHIDGFPGTT